MAKAKVKTKKLTVPRWQAGLFISLFHADGGDRYSGNKTEEAGRIIHEEHLLSLVPVSEARDGECTLECINKKKQKEKRYGRSRQY